MLYQSKAKRILVLMKMRKSKLESYEEILGVLVKKPLTIDTIAFETGMECTIVRQRLDSLIKNGLVNERASSKKAMFAITERGLAVYRTLSFQKYLEKVANAIRTMDEAIQVIPMIEDNEKTETENENY
jgi:predicted transcriptional regulator